MVGPTGGPGRHSGQTNWQTAPLTASDVGSIYMVSGCSLSLSWQGLLGVPLAGIKPERLRALHFSPSNQSFLEEQSHLPELRIITETNGLRPRRVRVPGDRARGLLYISNFSPERQRSWFARHIRPR